MFKSNELVFVDDVRVRKSWYFIALTSLTAAASAAQSRH